MTRTQLACCTLIASAAVLAVLIIRQASPPLARYAQADVVVNKDGFTLMTTSTRSDEEALFLLDGVTQKLLIYRLDLARGRLELAGAEDLPRLFGIRDGEEEDETRQRR